MSAEFAPIVAVDKFQQFAQQHRECMQKNLPVFVIAASEESIKTPVAAFLDRNFCACKSLLSHVLNQDVDIEVVGKWVEKTPEPRSAISKLQEALQTGEALLPCSDRRSSDIRMMADMVSWFCQVPGAEVMEAEDSKVMLGKAKLLFLTPDIDDAELKAAAVTVAQSPLLDSSQTLILHLVQAATREACDLAERLRIGFGKVFPEIAGTPLTTIEFGDRDCLERYSKWEVLE